MFPSITIYQCLLIIYVEGAIFAEIDSSFGNYKFFSKDASFFLTCETTPTTTPTGNGDIAKIVFCLSCQGYTNVLRK